MSFSSANRQLSEENSSTSNTVFLSDRQTIEPKVERVLRWFEKEADDLVGEKVLDNVKLEHLQKLFGISPENPMYDCYRVETSKQIDFLQQFLNTEIDMQSYEYFVECDAVQELNPEEIQPSVN